MCHPPASLPFFITLDGLLSPPAGKCNSLLVENGGSMTAGEFEKATENDLRRIASQRFNEASKVVINELARTALLTEARFYLDEIDRRDDRFRSRRDLILELVVIGLIAIEIVFSTVAYYEGKAEFAVLSNLEASSKETAATLAALQQTTEAMNKTTEAQAALSYEVALKVQLNLPDSVLEITDEGRTPVTLWGMKISDQPTTMQATPTILAPGAPDAVPAAQIVALATDQMNKKHAALIPLTLFLKNEKGDEFVARYRLMNRPTYGPFVMYAKLVSVTRTTWSKETPQARGQD
jgi:hypothetical protein